MGSAEPSLDGAEAGPVHQGDAGAHGSQQAQPRSLHHDQNDQSPVLEVPLGQIQDVVCQAFFGEVEEIDSEETDCEKIVVEEAHHLFAYEESKLELKDERSS